MKEKGVISMGLMLLILLICLIVLALPTWPYSRAWGYGPTGLISLVLIVIIALILANIIAFWTIDIQTEDNKTTIKIEKQQY